MPNTIVPFLNGLAGRFTAGVVDMSMDHPVAMALILAMLAGAAVAVLLDVLASRETTKAEERPIRLWRQ